ncbi:FUSC family protein [Schumannella luteola]
MADSAPLRRLARRVHVRALVSSGWRRMLDSLPAALQIVIAAVASYSIAHWGLGHAAPIIAVTVTITTLGLNRDARPRRVLETSIGITVGIALSEVVVLLVGKGWWQLAVVLFATLAVTRALSANPAFAIAAAVQSSLVVLLPDPVGGPFTRSLDGLVAGAVALAVTALIPRDPRKAAARDARVLFSVFRESIDGLADGVARADHPATELALERLRRTQSMVDDWTTALDTATSIARISPWLRRQLPELEMQARVLHGADLTSRHLRSIARRVTVMVEDEQPRPELAAIISELGTGIRLLGQQVEDRELTGAARSVFEDLATRLDPAVIVPDGALRESVVVVLLRPLVVDLLVATGMSGEAARALLPPVTD